MAWRGEGSCSALHPPRGQGTCGGGGGPRHGSGNRVDRAPRGDAAGKREAWDAASETQSLVSTVSHGKGGTWLAGSGFRGHLRSESRC